MSRMISFQCSDCGCYEFNIDLDDPDWFTGGSHYCMNCAAGRRKSAMDQPDADFFWNALKGLFKKSRGKKREAIQNALKGLVEHLTDYSVLEKNEWLELLLTRPDLISKCPVETLTSDEWEKLLIQRPELIPYCDWKSVSFSSGLWKELILQNPDLDAHCPWDSIKSDDWEELLKIAPELQPEYDRLLATGYKFEAYCL